MASIGSVFGAGSNPPSATATSSSASSSASATNSLANQSTILLMLVTLLKNQDPSQPMDSTAFLGELAQFSQLEQLVSINSDLQKGIPVTNAPGATTTPTAAS